MTRFPVLWVLLLSLLASTTRAEWVEIPHLKPATGTSTISSTTINPAASFNGGGHVQLLLSHLSGGSGPTPASGVRWVRPVSDLLDYKAPGGGVSSPPWITGQVQQEDDGGTRRWVNVSSKVEVDEEDDEQDGEEEEGEEEQYPVVQTALLPFGNRYEEESIETVTAPKAIQPIATQHYDDFDDYDERVQGAGSAPTQHQQEYHQDGTDAEEEEEEESAPEEENHQEQPSAHPVTVVHVRPIAASGGGGFGGFVDFLRRMQASFVQRTARTIGEKIRTLAGMRDQLMRSIEHRIATLWQSGDDAGRQRRRRERVKRGGGWMEPHGGTDAMDFPSAEGALLTISFLTFAVFLIKLVLQVINTIKAKHYTYSTFAAATPVSGGLLVKRTRRHTAPLNPTLPDHMQAILRNIDGVGYRHNLSNRS
uniref:Uncharacterized protein n=1 Tax=Anopheles farauti TaxID=69004 RepID=A0A182Q2F8_9DIPT